MGIADCRHRAFEPAPVSRAGGQRDETTDQAGGERNQPVTATGPGGMEDELHGAKIDPDRPETCVRRNDPHGHPELALPAPPATAAPPPHSPCLCSAE